MRYFSLFSGIGGFELGIQRAYENTLCTEKKEKPLRQENTERVRKGEEKSEDERHTGLDGSKSRPQQRTNGSANRQPPTCVGYSETDKHAISIYERHFNHENYGDITQINAEDIPDHDILIGGFPCQAFSLAGKRGGFTDTRGTLFFEIARIASEKRPPLIVLENVKGLLSHDKGRTFGTILTALDEMGYDAEWEVLNSKNFGVPQNRERVFIIGHLRGQSEPKVFPLGGADEEDTRQCGSEVSYAIDSNYWKGASGKNDGRRQVVQGGLQKNAARMENQSCALTEAMGKGGGHTPIVNSIRRLTPTECERLQGFPDGWTQYGADGKEISDTQRYKTIGNAVTVNVVEAIFRELMAYRTV